MADKKSRSRSVTPGAKGDITVGSGSAASGVLAVGTNNYVLTADSTQTTGVKWAALPASGSMTLISRQTPSASTGFSFSSIPSTYTDLYLRWYGPYLSAGTTQFYIRLNNISTSSYAYGFAGDSNGTFLGSDSLGDTTTGIIFAYNNTNSGFAYATRGSLRIANYANTSYYKEYESNWYYNDGTYRNTFVGSGVFSSTSAVTSIDIVRLAGTGTINTATGGYVELWGVN